VPLLPSKEHMSVREKIDTDLVHFIDVTKVPGVTKELLSTVTGYMRLAGTGIATTAYTYYPETDGYLLYIAYKNGHKAKYKLDRPSS